MRKLLMILLFFCSHAKGQEMFFALNHASQDTVPFITEWVIPSNSYTLSLSMGASGSSYSIDWGDGTLDRWSTVNPSHLYATAGTYDITIKGVCKTVNFGSKSELRTILQWGDVYCTTFTCSGSGLDSITTNSSSTFFGRCTSLNSAFNATKIRHIPAGLLNSANGVASMNQIFYTITTLTDTIPAHLLDKCVSLTTIQQGFRGSTNITGSIPVGFLDYCTNLTDVSTLFFGLAKVTGPIPSGFFNNNTKLTTVAATFYGMTGLTGTIPNIFDNNTLITAFNQAFQNCTHVTGVSSTLFANTTAANNFSSTFNGDAAITSAVPDLWNTYPSSTHTSCFTGCTNASNYALIPTGWL